MTTRLFSLLTSLVLASCLTGGFARLFAQNAPDPFSIGALLTPGAKNTCPLFIGGVISKSPAESAGVRAGDRLLAVDGQDVRGLAPSQVAMLIRSDQPGNAVLKLWRGGNEIEVVVPRQRNSEILSAEGMKRAGPFIVPLDTTEAEVKRISELEEQPVAGRAFPLHYPLNPDLYYGGFEIKIYAQPPRVVVSGLEQGPASRAGIHPGDVILSVNGIDPTGKSPAELEALFSSDQPKTLNLAVDRVTAKRTIGFQLEKAADVLKENHKRLFNGTLVPDGLAYEDIPCFINNPAK